MDAHAADVLPPLVIQPAALVHRVAGQAVCGLLWAGRAAGQGAKEAVERLAVNMEIITNFIIFAKFNKLNII